MSRLVKLTLLCLPLLLVGLPLGAQQDDAIDADYRVYDTVYVKGQSGPLQGKILKGRSRGAKMLVMRLTRGGIVVEYPRGEVEKIISRETPGSAAKSRSQRIRQKGTAEQHRRLAEWCHKLGLTREAEVELRRAAEKESDPKRALAMRERLVDLMEARAEELDGNARDEVLEGVLEASAAAGDLFSPRLALGEARVALVLELPETAVPLLERARDDLDKRAASGTPTPDPIPMGSSREEAEGGDDDGSADENKEDGEDGEDGEGADEEDGEDQPPRIRRFRRDGEDLPEDEEGDGEGEEETPPEALEPDDFSDKELAGLNARERILYRDVMVTLGRACVEVGKVDVAKQSYSRILEVWPQDKPASLGLARIQSGEGRAADGITHLTAALKVYPQDPHILLLRGQLQYLLKKDPESQADLQAALLSLGDDTESPLGRSIGTALGLVHIAAGRFVEAKKQLEAADANPGFGPARLARGLLAEFQGDLKGAGVHYDEAERLLGPGASGEVSYVHAFTQAAAGDLDGAQAALKESIRRGYDFRLALRALIDLARKQRDSVEEARLVELLYRATPDPDVDLLASLGRVHLANGRVGEAEALFTRGLEKAPNHLPSLRGLAYCAYNEGERAKARKLFQRVMGKAPKDAWAAQGVKNLKEARTRRVWTDDFDRPGPDVQNNWEVETVFGVKVRQHKGGPLEFAGKQTNQPKGKTRLYRAVEGETVVKFEARLIPSALNGGRFGLRFETRQLKIILFREPSDGNVYFMTAKGKKPFEDPVDLGPWPGPGAHTLAIDIEDPKRGVVAFLVDGQRRKAVDRLGKVSARAGYDLVVYGQGDNLGDPVEFAVEQVRIYVLRDPGTAKTGPGY